MQPSALDNDLETLGSITCPSGLLIVLDGGLVWMWSHDRRPLLPEWHSSAASANDSVDCILRGPDAWAAGQAFDRQNHPLYLFDIPRQGLASVVQSFGELTARRGFDATIDPLPERVPHRRRVDLAVERGNTGIVQYHGIWGVVIGDVPSDRLLPVLGERMPDGPDRGRWRRITIVLRDGAIASSRDIGVVLVDEARLLATDADALGLWHEESVDGLADIVFWGRDAKVLAAEIGAPPVVQPGEGELFGWLDLPEAEAHARGGQIHARRSDECKFALDFRPHNDQWRMMRAVRATPTESGELTLDGARLVAFATSWGDGAFPVEADLDDAGRVLRIRLELGCPSIVQRQRDMEELWHGVFAKRAIVSARVARDGEAVRFLYREAPDNDRDSGWRIFAGDEAEDYLEDPANGAIMVLRDLLQQNRSLKEIFRTEAPCAFERADKTAPFRRVEGFQPRDD